MWANPISGVYRLRPLDRRVLPRQSPRKQTALRLPGEGSLEARSGQPKGFRGHSITMAYTHLKGGGDLVCLKRPSQESTDVISATLRERFKNVSFDHVEVIPEVDDEGMHYLMIYAVFDETQTPARCADDGELCPAFAAKDGARGEFYCFPGNVLRREIRFQEVNGLRSDDLAQTAADLLNTGLGRPRQSNLRRAISTVYYAMFHCLAKCCADTIVGGRGATRSAKGLDAGISSTGSRKGKKSMCQSKNPQSVSQADCGLCLPIRRAATKAAQG